MDDGQHPPTHTLAEQIPTVCTVADVCRILQISEGTYYLQRRKGTFPIPEIQPSIDSRTRFSGAHVKRYIDGDLSSSSRRKTR